MSKYLVGSKQCWVKILMMGRPKIALRPVQNVEILTCPNVTIRRDRSRNPESFEILLRTAAELATSPDLLKSTYGELKNSPEVRNSFQILFWRDLELIRSQKLLRIHLWRVKPFAELQHHPLSQNSQSILKVRDHTQTTPTTFMTKSPPFPPSPSPFQGTPKTS